MSKTSQDLLRRISIHVEESKPGAFEWVLSEADAAEPDTWKLLKRGRKATRTYHAAMADGLRALELLIDDLDIGPRSPADVDPGTESEAARGRTNELVNAGQRKTKAAKNSAFGFGLPQ